MNLTPEDRALAAGFAGTDQPQAGSAAPSVSGEPVAWQWRKKDQPWTLEKTFNSQVFATTPDSEVRPLYAASIESIQQDAQALREALSGILEVMPVLPRNIGIDGMDAKYNAALVAARTALGRTV